MCAERVIKRFHEFSIPTPALTFLIQEFLVEPPRAVDRRWSHGVQVLVEPLLELFEFQSLGSRNGSLDVLVDQFATANVFFVTPRLSRNFPALLSRRRRPLSTNWNEVSRTRRRLVHVEQRGHTIVEVCANNDAVQTIRSQTDGPTIFDRALLSLRQLHQHEPPDFKCQVTFRTL
jgi:hypothetical protein